MLSINHIGDKIRKLRTDKGLTQKQLGEKLDYSESSISYIEKGLRSFDIKDLPKLAEIFDVPQTYLLDHQFTNFRAETEEAKNIKYDDVMNDFKKYAKDKLEKNDGRS